MAAGTVGAVQKVGYWGIAAVAVACLEERTGTAAGRIAVDSGVVGKVDPVGCRVVGMHCN